MLADVGHAEEFLGDISRPKGRELLQVFYIRPCETPLLLFPAPQILQQGDAIFSPPGTVKAMA